MKKSDGDRLEQKSNRADGSGELTEASVRKKFADTAVWLTTLTTGADGTATTTFQMPENLTGWRIAM